METSEHLFVYGTLRRDADGPPGPRRLLQETAALVGEGTVRGRLFDAGGFPGAVRESEGRVSGEVYRLEQPRLTLRKLDRYEGCRPDGRGLFRRVTVPVRLDSGREVEAWIYLFNGSTEELPEIHGGDYLSRE